MKRTTPTIVMEGTRSMKKKLGVFACLILLGVLRAEEKNLVLNPGFEEAFAKFEYATGWTGEAFERTQEAAQFYPVSSLKHSGARAMVIRNLKPNDSRLIQWLRVEPSSYYRISAWIMTQGVEGAGAGASVCVAGVREDPPYLTDTKGTWEYLEAYGRTAPGQTLMPLALRLGHYGKLVKGSAAFDDVSAVKVDSIPDGVILYNFGAEASLATEIPRKGLIPAALVFPLILLIVLGAAGFAAYYFRHKLLDLAIALMEWGLAKAYRSPARGAAKASGSADVPADRRASVRESASAPVYLVRGLPSGGQNISEYLCQNISRDGFFVRGDSFVDFDIGQEVTCFFKVGGRRVEGGQAQVMRKQMELDRFGSNAERGMGLRFIATDSAARARIVILMRALEREMKKSQGSTPAQDPAQDSGQTAPAVTPVTFSPSPSAKDAASPTHQATPPVANQAAKADSAIGLGGKATVKVPQTPSKGSPAKAPSKPKKPVPKAPASKKAAPPRSTAKKAPARKEPARKAPTASHTGAKPSPKLKA